MAPLGRGRGSKCPQGGCDTPPEPPCALQVPLPGQELHPGVENLQALPQLNSLDLSCKLIQVLDTGEGQERIQELWDSHSHLPCLSFPFCGGEVLLPEE